MGKVAGEAWTYGSEMNISNYGSVKALRFELGDGFYSLGATSTFEVEARMDTNVFLCYLDGHKNFTVS